MFAYIKGIFESRTLEYIVIDVNGIGYKIFMSENSMKKIGEIGNIVKIYTYVKVREDDISIYGFANSEELKMFEMLISVSGIGAKSAIAVLSNIEPSTFSIAVVSNNVDVLKKLPGIGLKSAQRIILELKDKLKNIKASDELEEKNTKLDNDDNIEEAISALQVLGYSRKEIEKILPKINKNDDDIEKIIKKSLALLSK